MERELVAFRLRGEESATFLFSLLTAVALLLIRSLCAYALLERAGEAVPET